ncbi:MAG: response regulator [Cyclonatronaceae bacterium]
MIHVVIVEDNQTIRQGLKLLINGTSGYQCKLDYGDCESLLANIQHIKVDIVLMDIGLPGMSGIEGIRRVKEIMPAVTVLVLTVYEESHTVFEALKAGAIGYMVKKTPPARLLEAIDEAMHGGSPMSAHIARKVVDFFGKRPVSHDKEEEYNLTQREKELLSGLVDGKNYKVLAFNYQISIETVRFHFRNIYKKLHVHSQSEAIIKVFRNRKIMGK